MKYVIYVRKSTEDREDRQILSIESQIEEIQRKFPELNVVEIIRESKSAYKVNNRPEFQRMLEMFENGKIDGLLAWHPDRLAREWMSASRIINLLDRKCMKDLKFVSYNYDNTPEGKMMLAITLSQSKYFSEKLSVDVKRGMIKKCQMGSMPTKPPLGYMPDKMAEKGEKRHLKDPERFNLVRKMWDLILTGQYSVPEIVRQTKQWGLTTRPTKNQPAQTLSNSTVYKTFTNSYYTGRFQWNGEVYQGTYPSMISVEEFETVQALIGRKHIPRPQIYESLTSGLVACPCGGSIVLEYKKKFIKAKNGYEIYKYVRCSRGKKGQKCQEKPLKLQELEQQMVNYLKQIKISDAFHKWAIKNLHQLQAKEFETRQVELKNLRKSHDECQQKLDLLLDLKISPNNIDGSLLSDEEFLNRKKAILNERERLSALIKQIDLRADKWESIVTEAFDVAMNAQKQFEQGDIKEKKLILSKIGANFTLSDQKLHIEAKHAFIVFEKYAPELNKLEEKARTEKERFGKVKQKTKELIFAVWSG